MRIFYSSDLHGSDTCFKKFVNSAVFFSADVLVLGGDLSGKGVIPIVQKPTGAYACNFLGRRYILEDEKGMKALERLILHAGFYPSRLTTEEVERATSSDAERAELFSAEIREAIRRWIAFAEERLPRHIEFYWMLGNDDPPFMTELLQESNRLVQCERTRVLLKGSVEMISLGFSNRTPFGSVRELDEGEMEEMIAELVDQLQCPQSSIFNFHCPPKESGLDVAPDLRQDLHVVFRGGQPSMVPVGSTAVRKAIEQFQPVLGLHGHVHESRGIARIGKTLCLNPGSEYSAGILCGAIVNLDERTGTINSYQFVSG